MTEAFSGLRKNFPHLSMSTMRSFQAAGEAANGVGEDADAVSEGALSRSKLPSSCTCLHT